jgi:flavin-dependent thymidylate synthase
MTSGEVSRWADEAMFAAAPLTEEGKPVEPKVTLIHMTPDPLRVMAAAAELYRGNIVHYPSDISRDTALEWLTSASKNKLKAPLEFIDLHFFFEGVTRAFTHQLVRQRTAVYVQESMRFAVKENAEFEIAVPPSIASLNEDDSRYIIWKNAVLDVADAYNYLINAGVPAEDARGLLPTNIATRIHYKTNLRNLAEQAGMRLCSQAQHEWKQVWALMLRAMLAYGPEEDYWQQRAICTLFKPVCYHSNRCEFMAPTDRYCSIRDRVQAHYEKGEKSDTWSDIDPREPLHEKAARRTK